MVWGTQSYSGLAENTYFVYLALRTSVLGMGQTVRLGKRNTLCCRSKMEMYFYLVLWFLIFYFVLWIFYFLFFISLFIIFVKFPQNRQVMVTSLGHCCLPGGRVPQVLITENPAIFKERLWLWLWLWLLWLWLLSFLLFTKRNCLGFAKSYLQFFFEKAINRLLRPVQKNN